MLYFPLSATACFRYPSQACECSAQDSQRGRMNSCHFSGHVPQMRGLNQGARTTDAGSSAVADFECAHTVTVSLSYRYCFCAQEKYSRMSDDTWTSSSATMANSAPASNDRSRSRLIVTMHPLRVLFISTTQ